MTSEVRVLTQLEHVLQRADMYIGSTAAEEVPFLRWSGDDKHTLGATLAAVTVPPGYLHLFDEVLVNAVDNATRCAEQRSISVTIDQTTGALEVSNDGSTIPVVKHEGGADWAPTLTFSHFFSGTNFGDEEGQQRTWGGRFGIGVKAVNAWSSEFSVVCCDAANGKRLEQTWRANMSVAGVPCVKAYKNKRSSTTVRFVPDYARFKMELPLSDDVVDLLRSRVYNACVTTRANVSVALNGAKLALGSLVHYATALGGQGPFAQDSICDSEGNEVFRICVAARAPEAEPCVVAFVNGICCGAGTHVEAAWRGVLGALKTKVEVKPQHVKSDAILVLMCRIPNPEFESQTKKTLKTPAKKFGFAWTAPPESFQKALGKLAERATQNAKGSEQRTLEKSSKTTRGSVHVDKLDDAVLAGRAKADCTLLVTEGDSAKAFAVAGLSVVGRQQFGVYALRGKPMNTRNYADRKVVENEQCAALMKILGLQWNATVTAATPLRYQRVVILSDQDVDGSHICGLIINFFAMNWPSLFDAYPDFLYRFATPLIRVSLPSREPPISFFSEVEHERWLEARRADGQSTGSSKYFKGLGTSTSADAREYFAQWDHHLIRLHKTDGCGAALDLFFDQNAAAARKEFLHHTYDPRAYVDYSQSDTSWDRFLCDDMSHYSFQDNVRSIPSVVDGLKESQRKVLYAFLTRPAAEVKVAQAMAYAAEKTDYHHGEQSLGETIVGMAQRHVGTNNLALLRPNGQFGSRLFKPSVHSAFRYIFTQVDPIVTRRLFPVADDAVLTYRKVDGATIEPEVYAPIIPLVLVNGAHGIGTGFSTHVPSFDPRDVLEATAAWIRAARAGVEPELPALTSWYRHFRGRTEVEGASFHTYGQYEVRETGKKTEVHITELPVGRWTDDYKQYVREQLLRKEVITDFKDLSTEHDVHLVLYYGDAPPDEKLLKLQATETTANIHLFTPEGKIAKYTIERIVCDHAAARLALYHKRLAHQVEELEARGRVAAHKAQYITLVRAGSIDVFGSAGDEELSAQLVQHALPALPEGKYLVDLPNRAFTAQRAAEYEAEAAQLAAELERVRATDAFDVWETELEELRGALDDYTEYERVSRESVVQTGGAKKSGSKKRSRQARE